MILILETIHLFDSLHVNLRYHPVQLDEMLPAGIIEPSVSAWASPVCLVKKPDPTYRFCIDYRRVNAVSVKDAYPVPDIRDALDNLRGAKCFATIDLLSGYWQIGMTERAKARSAFCTRRVRPHFPSISP